jgi:hypothetical protein
VGWWTAEAWKCPFWTPISARSRQDACRLHEVFPCPSGRRHARVQSTKPTGLTQVPLVRRSSSSQPRG